MFSRIFCFITNKKGAESSKILNIFIHAPLLIGDDVILSLDCVVSQRPLYGTLLRLPRPLSLMFPYSRRAMIVLRWSLHGVVFDGHVFKLFVSLPPAVLIGFPQETNFVGSVCWTIMFLSAMLVVFHSR